MFSDVPVCRRRVLRRRVCASALLLAGLFGPAVQPGSAQDRLGPQDNSVQTGLTVTGHVICGDTQHPARFAQVSLIPAAEPSGGFDRGLGRGFGRTDLDGNFQIPNVSPGDYYVVATMPGYINLAPSVQTALRAGDTSGLRGVPLIHAGGGGGAAEVVLQRGATVSGTVQWDDGTPASGVQVAAVPASTNGSGQAAAPTSVGLGGGFGPGPGAFFGGSYQTDDRGRFRITGLPAGVYQVRASLQTPVQLAPGERGFQRTMPVTIWAPDKMRRTEASTVTVTAAEERQDLNLTLAMGALHTVSGQVDASSGGVHGGTVRLTDQTDSSLNRVAGIGTDGSFRLTYVPPGTYILAVSARSSGTPVSGRGNGQDNAGPRFQPFQAPVTVTDSDLSGISVTVLPAASTQ